MRTLKRLAAFYLALFLAAFQFDAAALAQDQIGGGADDDVFFVDVERNQPPGSTPGDATPVRGDGDGEPRYDGYRSEPACGSRLGVRIPECEQQWFCPPGQMYWHILGRETATGRWVTIGGQCTPTGEEPTLPEATPAEITPAIVLRALRRLGLPEAHAQTQPEGTTLVNFDTIFFADAEIQTRDVTLLGRAVTIEAEPVEFTWHHGDGTSRTTTEPGAPYPARDITHRYASASDEPLAPRVDVTYRARFQVEGGPWRPISETVTIEGPTGSLEVTEATPVLTR
ncbi:hypothetical protein [Nocardioides massiliensis]|nr:hypothetical protein [Nocardioides massiliensis]